MADKPADQALGHVLAWLILGFKGSTHQPRLRKSAMAALGMPPINTLHIKSRLTMLWGILSAGAHTPAFAVLMTSIMHAVPFLSPDASPIAQVEVLLRMDAAACENGAHPAWTPAFVRMAAEMRLLGSGSEVRDLVDFAKRWTAADATARRWMHHALPNLGNKDQRAAQLPPKGDLPKTWQDLPTLITGTSPAARGDSLMQLIWQASTYPHELYSASTKLRRERSLHEWNHDARARGMAWVHPVPTDTNAAQLADQDRPHLARKTLMIQNGRLLRDGTAAWEDGDTLQCPLCDTQITARDSSMHLMLDYTHLEEHHGNVLADVVKLVESAPQSQAPKASARVAVPLPAALVQCAQKCATATPATPEEHRVPLTRLLLCGQWPAKDEAVLNLPEHEAAALTWCASPAVWTPRHSALDELPAKRERKTGKLDSICAHPSWKLICARAVVWCAYVFDELCDALLQQHTEGTARHADVQCVMKCVNG